MDGALDLTRAKTKAVVVNDRASKLDMRRPPVMWIGDLEVPGKLILKKERERL